MTGAQEERTLVVRRTAMAKTLRTFTPEFRAEAVRLVTEQGRIFVEAAGDLDIGESTPRSWERAIAAGAARPSRAMATRRPMRRNCSASMPKTSGSRWSAAS